MSRVISDDDLLVWEVFPSGGKWGLPERPKIIFNCLSDPGRRARFVVHDGDDADAEEALLNMPDGRLRELLRGARELD